VTRKNSLRDDHLREMLPETALASGQRSTQAHAAMRGLAVRGADTRRSAKPPARRLDASTAH